MVTPSRSSPWPLGANRRAEALRFVLVALAYYVLGRFGMSMPYKLSVVTLLWLPLGVAVAAVVRWGWHLLGAVFLADFAIAIQHGERPVLALALAGSNVVCVTTIVALLRGLRFDHHAWKRWDVIAWCIASAAGTLAGATLGPTVLCLHGSIPWSAWPSAELMWWLGDLVGLLLAGPVLLALNRAALRTAARRYPEMAALAAVAALLAWLAFFRRWPASFALFHPMLLVVPLQVWAALRFGVFTASSLAMAISLFAAMATAAGAGSFAGTDPGVAVFSLWAFAGMLALLSLLITALEAERNESVSVLHKERRELRTLTDNLPDVVLRLDAARRVAFANRALEAEREPDAGPVLGLPLDASDLPYASSARWREAVERAFASARGESFEFGFEGRRGRRRGAAQMVAENDEQGTVQSVLIIVRDITEHEALELQLRQAQKLEAVGVLAGGIAHDFNNVLTAVIGNTQMAMMDLPEKHAVQEWLERVLKAANRARAVVGQMMAFSRRQEPNKSAVRLRHVVEEVRQLLRASIPSTIILDARFADEEAEVLADPNQLHQVLINLVTNSAQAIGGQEGRITIFLERCEVDAEAARLRPQLRPGRYLRLGISDTGRGMDAATQARIFEPFFTTKARGTGTGLGLAVVHGIVEQHGGSIVVYSEVGKGTTVMVYLPVHDPARKEAVAQAAGDGEPADAPVRGGGQRIMVVDDEEIVLQVAHGILRRLGYAPEVFNDPEAALRALQAAPDGYALLLTDLTMPAMKGTELAARVREARPNLPILLCTGFQGALVAHEAAQLKLGPPLLKPFSVDALAAAVAGALPRVAPLTGSRSAPSRPSRS